MKLSEYISLEEKSKVYENRHTCINSVKDFQIWYDNVKKLPYFFRGLKEASFKNYTSAQRVCITHDLVNTIPNTLVHFQIQKLKEEKGHILENYCKSIGIAYSDFFLMSYAQHYANGISLLLDITTDIDTALFFMCYESHFPTIGADTNSITNYASIYTIEKSLKTFDDVINHLQSMIEITQKDISKIEFQEFVDSKILELFKCNIFKIIGGHIPFILENKPYTFSLLHGKNKYQNTIAVGNLNITAQNGCFIYYDNDKEPYEFQDMTCVDIHKSLIPYITQNILIPKKKTKDYLFPNVDNIVNEAFINALADKDILADFSQNFK